MYFKTVPAFLRALLPSNLEWQVNTDRKEIFLTFDDGPIPEITPWVLGNLDKVQAKATFFCIGDNVRKYPHLYSELILQGHSTGNHTLNHLQAWNTPFEEYLDNVARCNSFVKSQLFRPPHGQITPRLARKLGNDYRLIMWSILSRDFDKKISPYECLKNVMEFSKPGSIVVFHDSMKAWKRLEYTLPRFLQHFSEQGYSFSAL